MDRRQNLMMVEKWEKTGRLLGRIKRDEMSRVDIAMVIEGLDEAFESAIKNISIRKTSGSVEMQRLFMKKRGECNGAYRSADK